MNRYRKLGTALLAGALLLAGAAGNALAWSAAACSTISNQASLTYSVGGVDQTNGGLNPLLSNISSFTVDSRVDLDVAVLASPVNATGTNQVLRFRITNLGNDTQRYQLQLFSEGLVDNFNMNNVRVYLDNNSDGFLDGGDTLVASDIGTTGPAFGADLGLTGNVLGAVGANVNTIDILVVSDVPAGQASGDVANYALKAISYQTAAAGGGISIGPDGVGGTEANNSCGNPVVVGDDDTAASPLVTGVSDVARDGADYAAGQYTVVAAGVTVTKAQTVIWDPINLGVSPQPIPGAYVRYTITVSNAAGAAAATLTQITDALVAQLAFDTDLATGGPTTFENALGKGFKVTHVSARTLGSPLYYTSTNGDADGASANAGTITAIFATLLPAEVGPPVYAAGELKANESVSLIFNAIIQ